MKKILQSHFYLLTMLILFTKSINAQWIELNGPTDFVSSLVSIDGTLFATTGTDGLYRSEDGGATWVKVQIETDNPDIHIGSFIVADAILYVSTSKTIYRSEDKGNTWVASNTDFTLIRDLKARGSSLFIGAVNGVFHSTDNGVTWNDISTTFPDTNIYTLAVADEILFAAIVRGSLLRTFDNGANWTICGTGLPIYGLNGIEKNGNALFAATDSGLFRSDDEGDNWSMVDVGIDTMMSFTSLLVRSDMILAGTDAGILCSIDGGENWAAVNPNTPLRGVRTLITFDNGLYAGNNGDGVMRSTDNGTTWSIATSGLSHMWTPSLLASSGTIFAGLTLAVYRSIDNGTNWIESNEGIDNLVFDFAESEGAVYALSELGGVHVFDENNNSWSTIITLPDVKRAIGIEVNGNDIFVATDSAGMFHTTTDGTECNTINTGLPPEIRIFAFGMIGGTLLAATYNQGTFRSADDGATWTEITSGLADKSVLSFIAKDSTIFAGTFYGVYRSDDNGIEWMPATAGIAEYNNGIYHFAVNDNAVYAGGHDFIYVSTNNGEQWTMLDSAFSSNNIIYSLAVTDEHLFVGMSSLILRTPLPSFPKEIAISSSPRLSNRLSEDDFSLHRTNSNNTNMQVSFTLPVKQQVAITVFNISGKEMRKLADGQLRAGRHTLSWDTRSLAPGCYAIRMETNTGTRTKHISVFR